MGDDWGLEDMILKQNIPGRMTTWDNDKSDPQRIDNESDSEDEADIPEPQPYEVSEAMKYGQAPGRQRPGIKGQLDQYHHYKRMDYFAKLAAKSQKDAIAMRLATGAVRTDPYLEEGSDHDSEDDDFMVTYRKKRLEELKMTAKKLRFGTMRQSVSKAEFLSAIHLDAIVILHILDPTLPSSRFLETLLHEVAPRRADLSFISMTMHEAECSQQEFDVDVLPLLVFYRSGQVLDTLFRVTDALLEANPSGATHADLEDMIDTSTEVFLSSSSPGLLPATTTKSSFSSSSEQQTGEERRRRFTTERSEK